MPANHRKIQRIIPFILFAIFLILGLMIYDDYGVSIDERFEREGSMLSLKYVLTKIPGIDLFTPAEKQEIVDTYSIYEDRTYGYLLQWPLTLVELIRGESMDSRTVFLMRHLWNFLNFYLASICFYLLLRKRFSHWLTPIIGWIFLILSPRYFAEAFYNNKDLLFCCWYIIALYFLVRMLDKPKTLNCLLYGLTCAIAANIRIVGFFALGAGCVFFLLKMLRKELPLVTFIRKELEIVISGLGFWFLFMPASWGNWIGFIKESFRIFSHYAHITDVFYMGEMLLSTDLPWHYIPVWMGISIPILYLLLLFCGVGFLAKELIRKEGSWNFRYLDSTMLTLLFVPMLLIIIGHSTMYCSWRHTYFLYVPLLYLAVLGFDHIQNGQSHLCVLTLYAGTAISCLLVGGWMVKAHPFQESYFNPLFRGIAQEQFEVDPMSISTYQAIQNVLDNDPREEVIFWNDIKAIDLAMDIVPLQDRQRIKADYYGYGGKPGDYIVLNRTYTVGEEVNYPYFAHLFDITADKLILSSVFQRTHESDKWGYDIIETLDASVSKQESAAIMDGDPDSFWFAPSDNQTITLDFTFREPQTLSGVTFYTGENTRGFPRNLRVYSSSDGENWQEIEISFNGFSDYVFTPVETSHLRLENHEAEEQRQWTISEILFHQ